MSMFGGASTTVGTGGLIARARLPGGPLAPAPTTTAAALAPVAPLATTLNASNAVTAAQAAADKQKKLAAAGSTLIGNPGAAINAPAATFQPKTLLGAK